MLAAMALIAAGCGDDDDDSGDTTDEPAKEQTTGGNEDSGDAGGSGDAEQALCDALKDSPEVDATAASDPQAAVDAAKEQVAYQENVVEAINDLPEPDDATKADALEKFKGANQKALEVAQEGLKLAERAIDDPQSAAADASKIGELAREAGEAVKDATAAGADLDLDLKECTPATGGR